MNKNIKLPKESFIDDKDAESLVALPTDDDVETSVVVASNSPNRAAARSRARDQSSPRVNVTWPSARTATPTTSKHCPIGSRRRVFVA